jgi:hypothetical protein
MEARFRSELAQAKVKSNGRARLLLKDMMRLFGGPFESAWSPTRGAAALAFLLLPPPDFDY